MLFSCSSLLMWMKLRTRWRKCKRTWKRNMAAIAPQQPHAWKICCRMLLWVMTFFKYIYIYNTCAVSNSTSSLDIIKHVEWGIRKCIKPIINSCSYLICTITEVYYSNVVWFYLFSTGWEGTAKWIQDLGGRPEQESQVHHPAETT